MKFSSNNKHELGDLYNYLNQKVITNIKAENDSTLGENYVKMVLSTHSS